MNLVISSLGQLARRVPLALRAAGALHREVAALFSRTPLRGPLPAFQGGDRLVTARYRRMDDYLRSGEPALKAGRDALERSLTPSSPRAFTVPGRCAICSRDVRFSCSYAYAHTVGGQLVPNWRESLRCPSCGFTNRVRGSLQVLLQDHAIAPDGDIYLTEQLTRTYRWLKGRFPRLVGSEYLGPRTAPGAIVRGLRHEDLERLSFADASLDAVVSFDVLEHVPHLSAALDEIARVLRPGGRLFFTAPMQLDAARTVTRAVLLEDGSIQHLLPPEYHGNPTDVAAGALCFRYFGWSVLDDLQAAGFHEAEVVTWWSRELGYLQHPQFAVTALRR